MTDSGFYGWKLLAACWVIMFLNLGIPAYGSSGLNALMAPALHLDRRALKGRQRHVPNVSKILHPFRSRIESSRSEVAETFEE